MAISLEASVDLDLSGGQNGHFARGVRRFRPSSQAKMAISVEAFAKMASSRASGGEPGKSRKISAAFGLRKSCV